MLQVWSKNYVPREAVRVWVPYRDDQTIRNHYEAKEGQHKVRYRYPFRENGFNQEDLRRILRPQRRAILARVESRTVGTPDCWADPDGTAQTT
jgi:hypothetical protein